MGDDTSRRMSVQVLQVLKVQRSCPLFHSLEVADPLRVSKESRCAQPRRSKQRDDLVGRDRVAAGTAGPQLAQTCALFSFDDDDASAGSHDASRVANDRG